MTECDKCGSVMYEDDGCQHCDEALSSTPESSGWVSLSREEIRFLLRAIREMSDPKTVKTSAKLIDIRTKLQIELRNQTNELKKPNRGIDGKLST
jgi:hypothetical protein